MGLSAPAPTNNACVLGSARLVGLTVAAVQHLDEAARGKVDDGRATTLLDPAAHAHAAAFEALGIACEAAEQFAIVAKQRGREGPTPVGAEVQVYSSSLRTDVA